MSVWSPERRGLTIGLVMTVTLIAFEGLAVATIMPAVRDDLGGTRLYGWTFSAFFLTSLISTVQAGRAADRVGVGPPFATGVILFAVGLVLGTIAPSMFILVLARGIQGLGAGAVSASAVTTVARGYPTDLRPRMFALMSTAWVVPGLLGPGLSGFIAETWNWRWVFGGLLPLIAVSAAVAIPRIRRLGPVEQLGDAGPSNSTNAIALAVSAGVLLAGLGDSRAWVSGPLIVAGAFGTVRWLSRLLPPGALRARPGLPSAVLLKGVLTFAFFGTDAYISLAVTDVRGRSVTVAGLALTAATLTWTCGAWIHARQSTRIEPRRLIAAGFGLVTAGIGLMIVGLASAAPLVTIIVAWAIAGLGMGIAYQSVTLAVLADAPEGQEGVASAAQQLTDLLGVATGTGVVGAVLAVSETAEWSTANTLRGGFAITLTVAICGLALSRRVATSEASAGRRPA